VALCGSGDVVVGVVLVEVKLGLGRLKPLPPGMRPICRGRGPSEATCETKDDVVPLDLSAAFMYCTEGSLFDTLLDELMVERRLGVGPDCAPLLNAEIPFPYECPLSNAPNSDAPVQVEDLGTGTCDCFACPDNFRLFPEGPKASASFAPSYMLLGRGTWLFWNPLPGRGPAELDALGGPLELEGGVAPYGEFRAC